MPCLLLLPKHNCVLPRYSFVYLPISSTVTIASTINTVPFTPFPPTPIAASAYFSAFLSLLIFRLQVFPLLLLRLRLLLLLRWLLFLLPCYIMLYKKDCNWLQVLIIYVSAETKSLVTTFFWNSLFSLCGLKGPPLFFP